MIYRLLGELEIGDQAVKLPGGHSLLVLAALLINANQRLSKSELLRAAWGEAEIHEAQLHKSVAALRALLGQIGRGDDLVTHARYGYEIRVTDDDLDMLLFRRLVREADRARSQRRADDEIRLLRDALNLWRGPYPLSNVPSYGFRDFREISTLEQRRKHVAVRLFDLELTRHGYERILGELALIAGYYPDDGRLAEQLMVAQYRCGHVTDATAAYERHAAALLELTGGVPDVVLRTLYRAVVGGDEVSVGTAEAAIARRAGGPEGAGMNADVAAPRQLPPDPADFVGRDDVVAETAWLLDREPGRATPIVVISGPGGVGKTALALRVAHQLSERYPAGQLFAELRGTAGQPADTSEVLAQFLRALGVPEVPEGLPERITTYRTMAASRRLLVVLDDAAGEAQIRDLIPASPACGVLVTARRRLPEIDGAHQLPPLAPLDRAAATGLFLRMAGNSGIDLQGEREAVDRVVALCGGLPLALRIAGALRVHDHPRPTAELADRLAMQGPEAFTYEGLSVARTIGAGFDQLDEDARQLFLELGVLALPSFGLWTAAALHGGTTADAAAALSQLAARHMIDLAEPGVRYRFHHLTREYAARRAQATVANDDVGAVFFRAYRALLTLARRAHAGLYGGNFRGVHSSVPDWDAPQAVLAEVNEAPLEWFERERHNIRAAVSHCADLGLTGMCWDLAVSAHEFYTICGYFDDWHATHTVALRACRDAGDVRGEGVVLAMLGQPALVASRRAGVSGLAELERAVGLLAECGDRHGQGIALRTLANALSRLGHVTRPLALFTEALTCFEASGDTVGRWLTLRYTGQAHLGAGRYDEALRVLQMAERAAGEFGERVLAQTKYWIGQGRLASGDLEGAAAAFNAVLEVYSQPAGIGHAYALHGLGDVAVRTGAFADAERYLSLAGELAREGDDAYLEGRAYLSAAEMYATRGQPEKQLSSLEQAVACFAGGGAVYLQARALASLARAHEDLQDDHDARTAWARVEQLYEVMVLPDEDRIYRSPDLP